MNDLYNYAFNRHDMGRIDKLLTLTNIETYWDDVRKLVRNVTSDRAIKRWQALAEKRFEQLGG